MESPHIHRPLSPTDTSLLPSPLLFLLLYKNASQSILYSSTNWLLESAFARAVCGLPLLQLQGPSCQLAPYTQKKTYSATQLRTVKYVTACLLSQPVLAIVVVKFCFSFGDGSENCNLLGAVVVNWGPWKKVRPNAWRMAVSLLFMDGLIYDE